MNKRLLLSFGAVALVSGVAIVAMSGSYRAEAGPAFESNLVHRVALRLGVVPGGPRKIELHSAPPQVGGADIHAGVWHDSQPGGNNDAFQPYIDKTYAFYAPGVVYDIPDEGAGSGSGWHDRGGSGDRRERLFDAAFAALGGGAPGFILFGGTGAAGSGANGGSSDGGPPGYVAPTGPTGGGPTGPTGGGPTDPTGPTDPVTAAVPLAPTLPLLMTGFAAFGLLSRRRRG